MVFQSALASITDAEADRLASDLAMFSAPHQLVFDDLARGEDDACVCVASWPTTLTSPPFRPSSGGLRAAAAHRCAMSCLGNLAKCNEELLELLRERLDVAAQSLADTKGPWRVWCHSAS